MTIISPENKIILIKRSKSFLWRIGMLAVAGAVDFAAVNLDLFDLPPVTVVIAGLVLGEISKYLNTQK